MDARDAVELKALDDDIACVFLNRPERLNAIDGALIDGVEAALDVLGSGAYRVAILTGAGRGFCAGADLSGTGQPWVNPTPATPAFKATYDSQVRLADLFTRLYELPIPVIAAVNGVAVGGGLAFALVCDIRVASEHARFGSVFIKAGFSSMDMGTSYLLPKIVGAGVSRELMLTGRIIDADVARAMEADTYDSYLGETRPDGRTLCGEPENATPGLLHWDSWVLSPCGATDAKVCTEAMALHGLKMWARWGHASGDAFDARAFLQDYPGWAKDNGRFALFGLRTFSRQTPKQWTFVERP